MANSKRLLAIVGPGILVAATGVGAADLATAAFTGGNLGIGILWVVLVGAGLKFVLSEGLARWQLATGDTLVEGCAKHLGRVSCWLLLAYLFFWSYFVGLALISACGVAAHAIVPLWDAETDKVVYAVAHSLVALALVRWGGYRLFANVMAVCIAVMFLITIATAIALRPPWTSLLGALVTPSIPQLGSGGLEWSVALMGGVGGTVTVVCYGYWIREEGRLGAEDLKTCRIDLASGYTMTALFGISMVVIGSQTGPVEGSGARLIVNLASAIEEKLGSIGTAAKWAFLIGAWSAIVSSLLGVWQSVPYLFADFYGLIRAQPGDPPPCVDTNSRPYKFYLLALAIVPAAGLSTDFIRAQKLYTIIGAFFIPILALGLLILNGQTRLIGKRYRNSIPTALLLVTTVVLFLAIALYKIHATLTA